MLHVTLSKRLGEKVNRIYIINVDPSVCTTLLAREQREDFVQPFASQAN